MKLYYFLFIAIAFFGGCGQKSTSTEQEEETFAETDEVKISEKEGLPIQNLLNKLLIEHKFDEARDFIIKNNIDLNDFSTISKESTYAKRARLLADIIAYSCDSEITKFLLDQDSNPNLPSVTVFVPEYSGEIIPEDFDIKNDDLSYYLNQGYVLEDFPLHASLSCTDSTSFYLLINSGANQNNFILQGAIKWNDTLLIKNTISTDSILNFVPNTDDINILKMLIPITKGIQFGVIEYGEGGDMFESDLMNAVYAGKRNLVWFMLESGAEPNGCLPSNIKLDEDGNHIGIDKNGMYPAVTALSIARDIYGKNQSTYEDRKEEQSVNAIEFKTKADVYLEIVELLKKHGATEIDKCLGP